MKKIKKKKNRLFIIHADPLIELPAYPTHTHGLTELGLPEFIMDPLAFGPRGNGNRINAAYDYFKKPQNKDRLAEILNGQTIKLTGEQLSPKYMKNDPYTYCFREVPSTFMAVKKAYLINEEECPTEMRFIQIYVQGDEYALMDEYYRNGVSW